MERAGRQGRFDDVVGGRFQLIVAGGDPLEGLSPRQRNLLDVLGASVASLDPAAPHGVRELDGRLTAWLARPTTTPCSSGPTSLRFFTTWEPPLGLRYREADAWAYQAALEVVSPHKRHSLASALPACKVRNSCRFAPRPAPRSALGYRWLLDAEISDERALDHRTVGTVLVATQPGGALCAVTMPERSADAPLQISELRSARDPCVAGLGRDVSPGLPAPYRS